MLQLDLGSMIGISRMCIQLNQPFFSRPISYISFSHLEIKRDLSIKGKCFSIKQLRTDKMRNQIFVNEFLKLM